MPVNYATGMKALMDKRKIVVRVENAAEVGAKSFPAIALAAEYAPDTVDSLVYDEIAKEIASGLKEKGARVDVRVVDAVDNQVVKDSFRDIIVGILGGIGAGLITVWLTRKR